MTAPKIVVLFYSTYGSNHRVATLAADAKRRCRTLCKPREVVARCYSPENKGNA